MSKRLLIVVGILCLCLINNLNAQSNALKRAFIAHKLRTNLKDFVAYHLENEALKLPADVNSSLPSIESRSNDNFLDVTPEAESELHAAINPRDTNNIIVCAMRNDPSNFLAPLTFPIYYTNDFGATWQLSDFNGTSENDLILGGGDPILVFDTEGTAYLCWLTLRFQLPLNFGIDLRFATSKDGGKTWIESDTPIDSGDVLDAVGGDFSKFVDKEWLAIDHSNSPYRNNIYATYLTIQSFGDGLATNITFKKKIPTATNFQDSAIHVNSNAYKLVQFTSMDVDSKGQIHVTFAGTLDSLNWSLYYAKSKDGGNTFIPETKIADFHIPRLSGDEPESNVVGVDQDRLYPCPHTVVDKSGGNYDGYLYTVWTANGATQKKTEGLDIYFSRSKDGGNTWESAYVLNDDQLPDSHQFYPSIAVSPKGTLVITWYDRREDAENLQTRYYMTYSEDGGSTFAPNFAVSSEAADFSKIGEKNGGFGIGEYTQTLATSTYGIPIWSDGRSNDGNIDLYVAFVPFKEAGGVVAIQTLEADFVLEGPSPNPTSGTTSLQVTMKQSTKATIQIFDQQGKLVKILFDDTLPVGNHTFEMNGWSAGHYLVTVRTAQGMASKKIVVQP